VRVIRRRQPRHSFAASRSAAVQAWNRYHALTLLPVRPNSRREGGKPAHHPEIIDHEFRQIAPACLHRHSGGSRGHHGRHPGRHAGCAVRGRAEPPARYGADVCTGAADAGADRRTEEEGRRRSEEKGAASGSKARRTAAATAGGQASRSAAARGTSGSPTAATCRAPSCAAAAAGGTTSDAAAAASGAPSCATATASGAPGCATATACRSAAAGRAASFATATAAAIERTTFRAAAASRRAAKTDCAAAATGRARHTAGTAFWRTGSPARYAGRCPTAWWPARTWRSGWTRPAGTARHTAAARRRNTAAACRCNATAACRCNTAARSCGTAGCTSSRSSTGARAFGRSRTDCRDGRCPATAAGRRAQRQ
jgi:hypothetical protein